MRRRILFRAKISHNGEWLYGSIVQRGQHSYIVADNFSVSEVDPATVGQLICEVRKSNGEKFKIFEHDILCITWKNFIYKKPLVALWDGEENGFVLYKCDKLDPLIRNDGRVCPVYPEDSNLFRDMTEIVGNAIDNPEMIDWLNSEKRRIYL